MKIITVLMFLGFMEVHATTSAQNLTINQHNTSLEKVFTEIKKQTGYLFLYNHEWIKLSKNVDINVKNATLHDVLEICFNNQPLTYSIVDKTIVVQLKKKILADLPVPVAPAAIDVRGVVKDSKGEPLPGVTVMIKGTSLGIQTDVNGAYRLTVPNGEAVLVFKFIGFKTKEVAVGSQQTINVTLEETSSELNEVVVSGYTMQNKAEFTGSASRIGAEEIANRPVQSFEQALAGQAAGVNVIQPSGVLNNPPVFRIRGFNSISLSSYPLIIIDGVALFTGAAGSFAANNPLADINPSDIESLDILKDASATAIYGSRAANGVVVITTKKGKKGTSKATYDGWVGLTSTYNLPKILNAEQYVTIKNEALVNAGAAPGYKLQYKPDGSLVDTRWYDYAYQTGVSHSHNLSFSGGSEKTSYFASAAYSKQEGIMVQNTFERKIGRVNIDHKLTSKLTVGTNFSISNSFNKAPSTGSLPGQAAQLTGLAREAMVLPPSVAPYNPDGSYNIIGNSIGYGAGDPSTISGYYNPVVLLALDKYSSESNAIIGNVFGELEIIKNLKFKTSYSLDQSTIENIQFTNPLQGFPGYDAGGSAVNASVKRYRWDYTNTLNYKATIGQKHHIDILGGYEEIKTTVLGWGATRTKLTDPYYNTFQGGFSTITVSGNTQGENRFRSYFSNLFYDFDKKYLLSASFRTDGYSGLAKDYKFGNFGGGSVGWNVAEENFFKSSSLAKVITTLKVRGSYGKVGNVNIGDYPALSLYNSGLYGGTATLGFNQAGNPDLRWESSWKTDIGLNIGFFNERFVLDVDYYNNTIDGMILNAPQAPSKGIPGNSITTNIGSMYNRGIEISLDAHIINKGNFKWTANLNFSTLKNRVTELANGADIYGTGLDPSNITRVGYSLGSIYVVETTGVNPQNGQRMFVNRNGQTVQYSHPAKWTYLDGTPAPAMDAKADGKIFGPSIPTYYGGFNNTFQYKNFDMAVNIGFSGGNKLYNGTKTTLMDQRFYNNSVDIMNRWTTPGQVTDVPRVVFNDNFSSGSSLANTASVESGSFIKLRNAAIGYRLPQKLAKSAGISSMRVYLQGSNLFTITKYTGTDPEVSSNGDSNSAPGVEKNSAPQARTVTLGVNIGF